MTFPDNPPVYTPPSPFPQRFRKTKLDELFAQFLNMFKKLEISILFVDALAQIPNYVKFKKEIMNTKKKLEACGIISMTENYSAIIQRKLLEKLKDSGSFTIPCIIRNHTFSKALCDIWASINLMPYSMAKKMNLGKVTPITLSLQIPDRSLTFSKGIIEDVLVKVDKFIFPVDFVVLDMEEDKATPIILGRPFLTIDVKNGESTPRVGEDQVNFNLYKRMEFTSMENASCMMIDTLIPSQEDVLYDFGKSSPLEQCLTKSLTTETIGDEDLSSTSKLIETILTLQENKEESALEKERKTPDGLVLKGLLKGLKYAFLGYNDTKPVIISSKLDNDMEVKFLGVLEWNSEAFAWFIEDIKGISPSICMHKILMEEDHAPSIEHQRR